MPSVLFEFEITGDEEARRALVGVDRNLRGDRLREPWERATELTALEVRERVPHWRGHLLASIDEEVLQEEDEILGVVYSDLFYTPFQERGTGPYFPNVDALEEWAADHDTDPWTVALAIFYRGIVPLKFFEQGLTESEQMIFDLIGHAVGEIVETGY